MKKKKDRDIIVAISYWPVKILMECLGKLPLTVLYFFFKGVQKVVFDILGYRRRVIDRNMNIVFPEKNISEKDAIRKAFKSHFFEMVGETVKTTSMNRAALRKRFEIRMSDEMKELAQSGKDIIIAGGHVNHWEWAVSAAGDQLPIRTVGIYKPLSNPVMDRIFKDMRERFGTRMVAMKEVVRDMYRPDRPPTAYLFLSDQSTPFLKKAHMIPFFGIQTPFVPGMGELAHRLNIPVFYFFIRKISRGHYIATFETLVREPGKRTPIEITRMYVEKLEENILNEAPNWLWSHKRWKRVLKY